MYVYVLACANCMIMIDDCRFEKMIDGSKYVVRYGCVCIIV